MSNPSRGIAVVQMYKYSHIIITARVKLSTDFPERTSHTLTGSVPDVGSIHQPESFKSRLTTLIRLVG